MNIDTFIFDLGGVIIDLDEKATFNSFSEYSGLSIPEILKGVESSDIFYKIEKGFISEQAFRNGLRDLFKCDIIDTDLDMAWNAMLGAITQERLDLLTALRDKYKVLILSNTNSIHENAFNRILKKVSGKDNLSYFADTVFFSHELHMRKPDIEIYEEILKLSATKAESALFLDDKEENLLGAREAGINTKRIEYPDQILELRKYV
ncbi:MAG: HAD family phosphatase [Cyclobacteriaceae bacterium]